MIRVKNLVKRFGPTLAVDDLSFAVGKGEVVGFLGPNGAGKTTTIRVLACFHSATSGTAEVAGFDVFDKPVEVRRRIGYLPENVPLYTDLRVEEYLHYRAALKGVARSSRKASVVQAMERCGVVEVRRKLVGQVSRGYRQRVGLADALVAKPPILILDEPTSGLDPNQRLKMKGLIKELSEEHTILFSSHILSEVSEVSSRILIINQGKLCADGSLQDLLEQSGSRRLVVTAAMDGHELSQSLQGLSGLKSCRVTGQDGQMVSVSAEVLGSEDPRDAAFALLREKGVAIRELSLALPTLEEVFRETTSGGVQIEGGGQ
ncbi:MAG: ABC transporter ATP-binding protein [Planctomycetota bacterium]|jgi:ABC-2 type transport system ATP-binding protein